ncbi:MAG: YcxB family protein [Lachnospiraceae bacterium]|nr:YcxB family protein [Lachnospiraceae bacterium]
MHYKCEVNMTTGLIFDYLLTHTSATPGGFFMEFAGMCFLGLYVYTGESIAMGIAAMLILYFPLTLYMQARKQKTAIPAFQSTIYYEFNDKGVDITTGKKKEHAAWKSIYKVTCSRKSIFIYTTKKSACVVPFASIRGNDDKIVRLISKNLPYMRIKGLGHRFKYRGIIRGKA